MGKAEAKQIYFPQGPPLLKVVADKVSSIVTRIRHVKICQKIKNYTDLISSFLIDF